LGSGKWDGAGELTEKEIIRAERNSGVVSGRVREIQVSTSTKKHEFCIFRSICRSAPNNHR